VSERKSYGYGEPNWEMLGRWLEMAPGEDGPFWALNLMKYRPVAEYGEGNAPAVSGREADDAYAPLGPLAAIGAMVAFHGDVARQPAGEPHWDRIGIVRYPTRAAFFAMQQRDDFKEQHVHKEAGMEVTIVMACHPRAHDERSAAPDAGALVLSVVPGSGDRASSAVLPGVTPVAAFGVEGVIVGDRRIWQQARFDRAADEDAVAALAAAAGEGAHVMVIDPSIDDLIESIASASTDPTPANEKG
jgi:hypothetical protein